MNISIPAVFRRVTFFFLFFAGGFLNAQVPETDLFKEFQPAQTSRIRETIEWSIFYMFDTNDSSKPRALLIGDSICNGYQSVVHDILKGKVNLAYWAGSKCVTDRQFFEELNLILLSNTFDAITFNNGLHSLTTDRKEWENAYKQAVLFIRAKQPNAKLLLVTSTPTENPVNSKISLELGEYAKQIAAEQSLTVIDLYKVTVDAPDKSPWSDGVHFKHPVVEIQGNAVAEAVLEALGIPPLN